MTWDQIPTNEVIGKTAKVLSQNGIETIVVENGKAAKEKVLELIPQNSEVTTMTSVTLETTGIAKEINESAHFNPTRPKLMDANANPQEQHRLRVSPEYTLGSVHAVTEEGNVLIASASGSQLPAYAYGAKKVILVVGAQKIVKNTEEGIKRIYEYTLPLEDKRALKAYGMHSGVNKLLIINKEFLPNRITLILVKEKLGF